MKNEKKLLNKAVELGFRDRDGFDNSPSWMSQELDETIKNFKKYV